MSKTARELLKELVLLNRKMDTYVDNDIDNKNEIDATSQDFQDLHDKFNEIIKEAEQFLPTPEEGEPAGYIDDNEEFYTKEEVDFFLTEKTASMDNFTPLYTHPAPSEVSGEVAFEKWATLDSVMLENYNISKDLAKFIFLSGYSSTKYTREDVVKLLEWIWESPYEPFMDDLDQKMWAHNKTGYYISTNELLTKYEKENGKS